MNILWKQPNNTLALTTIFDGTDPNEHAQLLISRGDISPDWILLTTNAEWALDTRWRHETYRWDGSSIVVDYQAAVEETKERLRTERAPLLTALDIQFQRNLETGADNTAVVAEKNRLRDITILSPTLTLDELFNSHA
jgi:hypothetical protein